MRVTFPAVILLAVMLAGCSASSLLSGRKSSPETTAQIPVNNELAMPPDLALRSPQATPTYQAPLASSSADVYGDDVQSPVTPARRPAAAASASPNDPYEKYGISKVKADGKPKTTDELRRELQAAIILEKRKKNPNYGSVFNLGNIFNDE